MAVVPGTVTGPRGMSEDICLGSGTDSRGSYPVSSFSMRHSAWSIKLAMWPSECYF